MNKSTVISFAIFAAVIVLGFWAINKYVTSGSLFGSATTPPSTE